MEFLLFTNYRATAGFRNSGMIPENLHRDLGTDTLPKILRDVVITAGWRLHPQMHLTTGGVTIFSTPHLETVHERPTARRDEIDI